MADKTDKADKGAEKDFTAREMEIMAKAWTCMEEAPKVDYHKLANATGMTNHRSAYNAWMAIKKKIMAKGGVGEENGGGEDGSATPKPTPNTTPKSTQKRKKTAASAGAEEDDNEVSPTKKTKGNKGKAKKSEAKAESDGDESFIKKEDLEDGEIGGN